MAFLESNLKILLQQSVVGRALLKASENNSKIGRSKLVSLIINEELKNDENKR